MVKTKQSTKPVAVSRSAGTASSTESRTASGTAAKTISKTDVVKKTKVAAKKTDEGAATRRVSVKKEPKAKTTSTIKQTKEVKETKKTVTPREKKKATPVPVAEKQESTAVASTPLPVKKREIPTPKTKSVRPSVARKQKTEPTSVDIQTQAAAKVSVPVHEETIVHPAQVEPVAAHVQAQEKEEEKVKLPKRVIKVNESLSVKLLSEKLGVEVSTLIKKFMSMGVLATINQRLDFETASLIADEYGCELEFVPMYGDVLLKEADEEATGPQEARPPVITIMGHVDHGKTSLLDTIRNSNIAGKEAGGITQHIGAYRVKAGNKELMFLDTPGHEAFTAMRARGVKVTDIVVLVVAADDGVMPQTIEAIDHAKAANVPIVVAVNKIDLPGAQPERVKQELSHYGLIPEAWGGKTIFVEVSAKKNIGIDTLIEMLALQADILELTAIAQGNARGVIIEAKLDKRRGAVATVLVRKGILKKGDAFVAGGAFGKIRIMMDDHGQVVNSATPAVPVEILGFNGVPLAGDTFYVVETEKEARNIAERRRMAFREEKLARRKHITLEELHHEMKHGVIKDLKLIIKADVRGSVEALRDSLERMSNSEIRVLVIHSGVGTVNESDILLAAASDAVVISFNVPVGNTVNILAEREGVDVRSYNIIYNVVNDVKAAMEGLLEPDYKDVMIGKAQVRKLIMIPKIGAIAGCMVLEGKITRGDCARLLRDGAVAYEGKIGSLKRFKDDVKEVEKGYECGITLDQHADVKEDDVIEIFKKEKVARRLESVKS